MATNHMTNVRRGRGTYDVGGFIENHDLAITFTDNTTGNIGNWFTRSWADGMGQMLNQQTTLYNFISVDEVGDEIPAFVKKEDPDLDWLTDMAENG